MVSVLFGDGPMSIVAEAPLTVIAPTGYNNTANNAFALVTTTTTKCHHRFVFFFFTYFRTSNLVCPPDAPPGDSKVEAGQWSVLTGISVIDGRG